MQANFDWHFFPQPLAKQWSKPEKLSKFIKFIAQEQNLNYYFLTQILIAWCLHEPCDNQTCNWGMGKASGACGKKVIKRVEKSRNNLIIDITIKLNSSSILIIITKAWHKYAKTKICSTSSPRTSRTSSSALRTSISTISSKISKKLWRNVKKFHKTLKTLIQMNRWIKGPQKPRATIKNLFLLKCCGKVNYYKPKHNKQGAPKSMGKDLWASLTLSHNHTENF